MLTLTLTENIPVEVHYTQRKRALTLSPTHTVNGPLAVCVCVNTCVFVDRPAGMVEWREVRRMMLC